MEGPWTNAVSGGKQKLIGDWGSGLIGCSGVPWCFDPSIFFDDDGSAYVTWGGGSNDSRPNTDNFDIVKLNGTLDGISGSAEHLIIKNLPERKLFEASYIHKHKGKYYASYSTGWQLGAPAIDYGMSDNVMGPYTWKGTILEDPSMNGQSVNGNNNHHGIADFKNHSYCVYHDRRIAKGYNGLEIIPAEDGKPKPSEGFHRSVSIDEMFYNTDGTIKTVKVTDEGPEQIEPFDPYDWYPALTSSKQKGIRSRSNFVVGKAAETFLLPLSSRNESWIRVSGVDFGKAATGFTVEAASIADGNKIEIRTGSATGTLAGTCTLQKTANKNTFVENKCEVDGLKGIVNYLFLVFKGNKDSTMAIKAWGFEGSGTTPPTPQQPYEGKAWTIPGKIEAEYFDIPGTGKNTKSYSDVDTENRGDAEFRMTDGVDIYLGGSGKAVGYTQDGEWLTYTVNVSNAGKYKLTVNAASSSMGSSMTFLVDDKIICDTIHVDSTGKNWSVYQDFDAGDIELTAGNHIVKLLITGNFVNIDWFKFEAIDENGNVEEITPALTKSIDYKVNNPGYVYSVFDIRGKKVAQFRIAYSEKNDLKDIVASLVKRSGFYLLKPSHGGMVKRITIIK